MIRSSFFSDCEKIQAIIGQPVLIVGFAETERAYTCTNFASKGRDFFLNEVFEGRDITGLVKNIEMHQGMGNLYNIQDQIEKIPQVSFSFGGDDFLLIKSIRINTI